MKIHMFSGSGFAWRIQLACELKGIPYDPAYMQPTPENLKSAAFLKLSPRGKVPAIEADGYSLSESLAIMAYLEAKHPERPLFGTTQSAYRSTLHVRPRLGGGVSILLILGRQF